MSISFSTDNLHPPLFRRICQRSDGVQNNFIPGGSGRPPATLFIFSCNRVSALRRASACAATMRSATISFSDGCMSVSSIVTPFISPLPESLTVTSPPPEVPSTSIWSSSACIASILDLSSVACFIRPRKSAIAHLLPRVRDIELLSLKLVGGRKFRVLGIGRWQMLGRSRGALAHVNDLGAGKAREHGLHQRIRLDAGLERGLPRAVLRSNRRLARLRRYDDHPAPAGPLRELARQIVDQRLCRARLQCDLQPTVLAAHQPHVALKGELDPEIALLRRQRDQILEPADGQ